MLVTGYSRTAQATVSAQLAAGSRRIDWLVRERDATVGFTGQENPILKSWQHKNQKVKQEHDRPVRIGVSLEQKKDEKGFGFLRSFPAQSPRWRWGGRASE